MSNQALTFFRKAYDAALVEIERMANTIENLDSHISRLEQTLEQKENLLEEHQEECEAKVRAAEERAEANEIDAKAYREKSYYDLADELTKAKERIKLLEALDSDCRSALTGLSRIVNAMGLKIEGPATVHSMISALSYAIQKHAPWSGDKYCGDEAKLRRLLARAVPFMYVAGRRMPETCNASLIEEIANALKEEK